MTVTADDVAGWSKLGTLTGTDLDLMDRVVAAVTDHIETNYTVSDPFTDREELAVMMQSARVWRRRDTPEGIIGFDELGAVRVTRIDNDVAELLTPGWALS